MHPNADNPEKILWHGHRTVLLCVLLHVFMPLSDIGKLFSLEMVNHD